MGVAVVTGASSGIGAALCQELHKQGHLVVGLSRREAPDADEHEVCDVSDRASVAAAANRVLTRHPQIAILINNAGIPARGGFSDIDEDRIEAVTATNYLGSVWVFRAFESGLVRGSYVVNIVSVAGTVAAGPYSAAKHAQLAFSRSLAVELAPRGVGVLTVNPGYVETDGFPQRGRHGIFDRIVVDPPLVATQIIEGMAKDKREMFIPGWYRPAAWFQALAPATVARLRGRRARP
ncbi:MAG: SDR family NAD(P)-dependent oxidoreductase [Actinobacteria bacterium]|uniref:Unannotated protein n=1 Tax=freshwater metagenome TaxID=449393 RepID=A0A6J6Q4F9_9ZZZZ|nr:SDR family NAD(P)-dependent oxidoreductase [Actinomycetota bacterium]